MGEQARPAMQMIPGGGDDPQRELTAMRAVADALRGLDPSARLRVLRWALSREDARDTGAATPARPALNQGATVADDGLGIDGLSDLFEPDATNPPNQVALRRA
jgi:hypothetical protein